MRPTLFSAIHGIAPEGLIRSVNPEELERDRSDRKRESAVARTSQDVPLKSDLSASSFSPRGLRVCRMGLKRTRDGGEEGSAARACSNSITHGYPCRHEYFRDDVADKRRS